jgi:hypothetical protein
VVAANAVFVTVADHPPLSAITAMGSAPWWWRLSLKLAICISIDMRLWMTEVILEQPAKPPHLVSRLAQTHHPEQHRDRDGAHQKSHRDRKSIQPSYPQLPLGRSGCRHSLGCASFIAQHTGVGCDQENSARNVMLFLAGAGTSHLRAPTRTACVDLLVVILLCSAALPTSTRTRLRQFCSNRYTLARAIPS